MDEGSGDSAQAAIHCASAKKENGSLEAIQSSLAKLRLSNEDDEKNWAEGQDEAADDATSSTESTDVEPICSYPYGYLKRQTVYTCLTCNDPTKPDWKPAGVCIGCSYACHQGHDLISMETRRNFRCDCGNKKFPEGSLCILCPNKDDTNERNVYNDNYKGTFCSCHCKESDCDAKDPLYQCVVCEDWFHASHCNAKTEGIEKNYTDLICGSCTTKLDFLRYYEPFDSQAVVDEHVINDMMAYSEMDTDTENATGENGGNEDKVCKLEGKTMKDPYPTGQLWALGWRGKLCRCAKCKEMYAKLNVSFLLDKEDETRRYFSEDEDEETQEKICTLVRKFEEWLLQMEPQERLDLFQLEPQEVKEKMRDYFESKKKDGEDDFIFEDHLMDQLFDSFAEFILDADGGADYLTDMDALESAFGNSLKNSAAENGDNQEQAIQNATD